MMQNQMEKAMENEMDNDMESDSGSGLLRSGFPNIRGPSLGSIWHTRIVGISAT